MPNDPTLPTFTPDFFYPRGVYDVLLAEVPWVNVQNAPRNECFMALDTSLTYTYGTQARARVYTAAPMHPIVRRMLDTLNHYYDGAYNVGVLNAYRDQHQHLGWHSDDSPEQDPNHPIAVVSFGAARAIWIKTQQHKGPIPECDRYMLTPGSLFVMPPGFQATHYHKIPKHDRACGGRISITYRKLDR